MTASVCRFQSTHPRGVRLLSRNTANRTRRFQSTHPRGVRHQGAGEPDHQAARFNPRTRVGCDVTLDRSTVPPPPVSIHAPAWGATSHAHPAKTCVSQFQSTHPRGVRLQRLCQRRHVRRVSIHAPAWGATGLAWLDIISSDLVSIHAPAWGATADLKLVRDGTLSFNPRTRVGCDIVGAGKTKLRDSFNPRTRVGCDDIDRANARLTRLFQSTHPRGVRRRTAATCDWDRPFQSTHPRGVRPGVRVMVILVLLVSIHAPAWGATVTVHKFLASYNVSIHAPAWGATRCKHALRN